MPRISRLASPLAIFLLCLPLLVACGQGNDDTEATNATDDAGDTSVLPMTLAEWLFPPDVSSATDDPVGVAHLSITPMKAGDNTLTVRLTDLDGDPLDGELSLVWHPLVTDGTTTEANTTPAEDERATWQVEGLSLNDGWYAFDVGVTVNGNATATSTMYALLPDPSVYGGEAVETPDSDPDAEALYQRALEAYGGWQTGRWRENLGSGQDVLVVTRYSVDASDPDRSRMEVKSVYAGAFQPKDDGSVSPVQRNFGHRIAIGERWWSFNEGEWSESSSLPVASFAERADVYSGATGIQPAGTETIDGVETQRITFYLPPKGGQAEAWFVWWIDPDSGNLVRMAMIAQMHFMIWDFYDIDAPIEIEPPGSGGAPPAASPAATPAAS